MIARNPQHHPELVRKLFEHMGIKLPDDYAFGEASATPSPSNVSQEIEHKGKQLDAAIRDQDAKIKEQGEVITKIKEQGIRLDERSKGVDKRISMLKAMVITFFMVTGMTGGGVFYTNKQLGEQLSEAIKEQGKQLSEAIKQLGEQLSAVPKYQDEQQDAAIKQ